MIAETEVSQSERGDILVFRHVVGHLHARGGGSGEVGIVLEIDGVVHLVGGVHIAEAVVIARGSSDFVGVVGAVHLFGSHL